MWWLTDLAQGGTSNRTPEQALAALLGLGLGLVVVLCCWLWERHHARSGDA